jgi:hypothetical protein
MMSAHHIALDAALHRTTPVDSDGHDERSAMSDTTRGLGAIGGFEIRTQGHLGDRWSDWFDGVALIHDSDGTTVIRCPALDQAALHGLLAKVRDLGLAVISVTPMADSSDDPTHPKGDSR